MNKLKRIHLLSIIGGALLFLCGFKPGDVLHSENGNEYVLVEELGSGYFSHVWQVKETGTGKLFAIKVFKDTIAPNRVHTHLQTYRTFLADVDLDKATHVLRYYPPETVYPEDAPTTAIPVIRSELATSTVNQLTSSAFKIDPANPGSHEKRIRNARTLLMHMLSGVFSLAATGYRHNDITPNNVIFQDGFFKLADLDSLTGQASAPRAADDWELFYAPPEFSFRPVDQHLSLSSDLYSIGAVAMWALTESNVLNDLIQHLSTARLRELGYSPSAAIFQDDQARAKFILEARQSLGYSHWQRNDYLHVLQKRIEEIRQGTAGSVTPEFHKNVVLPLTELIEVLLSPLPQERLSKFDNFLYSNSFDMLFTDLPKGSGGRCALSWQAKTPM